MKVREALRTCALSLPEAWEDRPWGGSVIKVRKKIFVFLGPDEAAPGGPLSISVKVPESKEHALSLPGAAPTRYGLGRSGWVTMELTHALPPVLVLAEWVEESYRAVAPKTLAAKLPIDGPRLPG